MCSPRVSVWLEDFAGGDLAALGKQNATVEAVIESNRGTVETVSARPLHAIDGYRAMFDVVPPDDSTTQIDLRLYLRSGGKALTETWLYQWNPPPAAERRLD